MNKFEYLVGAGLLGLIVVTAYFLTPSIISETHQSNYFNSICRNNNLYFARNLGYGNCFCIDDNLNLWNAEYLGDSKGYTGKVTKICEGK